jgi:hypothetical protein
MIIAFIVDLFGIIFLSYSIIGPYSPSSPFPFKIKYLAGEEGLLISLTPLNLWS